MSSPGGGARAVLDAALRDQARTGLVAVGSVRGGAREPGGARVAVTGPSALPGIVEGLRRGGRAPVVDLDGFPPAVLAALEAPAVTCDPALGQRALALGRRVLVPAWAADVAVLLDVAVEVAGLLVVPGAMPSTDPPGPAEPGALRWLDRRGQVTLVASGPLVEKAASIARMLTGRGMEVGVAECCEVPPQAPTLLSGDVGIAVREDPLRAPAGWRPVAVGDLAPRQAMEAVLAALPLRHLEAR